MEKLLQEKFGQLTFQLLQRQAERDAVLEANTKIAAELQKVKDQVKVLEEKLGQFQETAEEATARETRDATIQ